MYLPEYNSRKIARNNTIDDAEQNGISDAEFPNNYKSSVNQTIRPYTPENERKPPSGDENPSIHEHFLNYGPSSLPPALVGNHSHHQVPSQQKKHKKFSYQSTVRVLEKRKLEEKLSKEVAAKEEQRLREAQTMKMVRNIVDYF